MAIVMGPPNPPGTGKWVLTFGVVEAIDGVVTIQGAQQWTYLGPTSASISSLFPTSGPTTGGTTVNINGVGFNGTNTVKFGNTPVKWTFVSDSLVTATTKSAVAGIVDVTVVTTNDGTTSITPGDQFTFVNPQEGPVIDMLGASFNGSL